MGLNRPKVAHEDDTHVSEETIIVPHAARWMEGLWAYGFNYRMFLLRSCQTVFCL
jgi:hypothetical protein